jgi:hypothetical protein
MANRPFGPPSVQAPDADAAVSVSRTSPKSPPVHDRLSIATAGAPVPVS